MSGLTSQCSVREHLSGASEAGYHLVAYHDHAVPVADLAYGRPVLGVRHVDARRRRYRLPYEGGDGGRPLVLDGAVDVAGALEVAAAAVGAVGAAVRVGLGDVDVARHERAEVLRHGHPAAAEAHAGEGRPVVGARPAYDLPPSRLAVVLVVLLGHLERRLHRLRAAADEVDPRLPVRRERGDLRGQLHRRRADGAAGSVADVLHLLVDGVGDLAAAVADVLQPHAGHHVEPAPPLGILQPRPPPRW